MIRLIDPNILTEFISRAKNLINIRNKRGRSPLRILDNRILSYNIDEAACNNLSIKALSQLYDLGATFTLDEDYMSPLMLAESVEVAEFFIKKGHSYKEVVTNGKIKGDCIGDSIARSQIRFISRLY